MLPTWTYLLLLHCSFIFLFYLSTLVSSLNLIFDIHRACDHFVRFWRNCVMLVFCNLTLLVWTCYLIFVLYIYTFSIFRCWCHSTSPITVLLFFFFFFFFFYYFFFFFFFFGGQSLNHKYKVNSIKHYWNTNCKGNEECIFYLISTRCRSRKNKNEFIWPSFPSWENVISDSEMKNFFFFKYIFKYQCS